MSVKLDKKWDKVDRTIDKLGDKYDIQNRNEIYDFVDLVREAVTLEIVEKIQ